MKTSLSAQLIDFEYTINYQLMLSNFIMCTSKLYQTRSTLRLSWGLPHDRSEFIQIFSTRSVLWPRLSLPYIWPKLKSSWRPRCDLPCNQAKSSMWPSQHLLDVIDELGLAIEWGLPHGQSEVILISSSRFSLRSSRGPSNDWSEVILIS